LHCCGWYRACFRRLRPKTHPPSHSLTTSCRP
jgi:hypothetical protein